MKPSAQPGEALTASSGQRRPGRTLKFLAVAIFVAFPLPLAFLSGLLAWHQYRILTRWPAVDAVVTKVDRTSVTTQTSRQPVTAYGARFNLRYSAGGRLYDSSADLGYSSPIRSDVEHWMAQMPPGSHQRIRYDPSNPANISLAADYTPRSFAAPYRLAEWAGLSTVVCVVLFWLGWRAGKQESVRLRTR